MKRFRNWRRGRLALTLLAAASALSMTTAITAAPGAGGKKPSLDAGKGRVVAGAKVRLSGSFPAAGLESPQGAAAEGKPSRRPSHEVTIEFRPRGSERWRRAKGTLTKRDGSYSEKVKVRRTGRFRAVHEDGRRSRAESVRVRSRLRARVERRHVEVGEKVPVSGTVEPRGSRRRVVVRVGGEKLRTRSSRRGRFRVLWRADRSGRFKATARARGNAVAAGSRVKAGRATVYRRAVASWYGPGFYGNRTACGQTLTTSTVGVAHKTMPCGTRLRLRYRGRTVSVRVIDRGPYAHGREFDLTGATKQKLGFPSTGTVLSSR